MSKHGIIFPRSQDLIDYAYRYAKYAHGEQKTADAAERRRADAAER